jgi:hypothetical protein
VHLIICGSRLLGCGCIALIDSKLPSRSLFYHMVAIHEIMNEDGSYVMQQQFNNLFKNLLHIKEEVDLRIEELTVNLIKS